MKTIAIMQPYFLPYIGYFQLIGAVDEFVVYDKIKYTKKGWINRNRILQNGKDGYISLHLKKDHDYLDVAERYLADDFDREKLLRQIQTAYRKAPYYEDVNILLEKIIYYDEQNLFRYIYHSIVEICNYLEIKTKIIISSEIEYDNQMKGQDKVLAICEALGAERYINAIGGTALYHKQDFEKRNIELKFLKTVFIEYSQFKDTFIPALSIIDVLMFNAKEEVKAMLESYQLVEGEDENC